MAHREGDREEVTPVTRVLRVAFMLLIAGYLLYLWLRVSDDP